MRTFVPKDIIRIKNDLQYFKVDINKTHHRPLMRFTGVPMGMGSHRVVQLIEECGSVVCLDTYSGYKKTRVMMAEQGDLLTEMPRRYFDVSCAVMPPPIPPVRGNQRVGGKFFDGRSGGSELAGLSDLCG